MAKRSRQYVWQFVICLGFLSGLWTAIGIDPEGIILSVVGTAVDRVFPDQTVQYLFIILPTILLILSVWGAYRRGRWAGLCAVLAAYVAGLFIIRATGPALVLLLCAGILGYVATDRKLVRSLTGR